MYYRSLMNALEEETNKQESEIDTYKIRWIVRALDLLDGRVSIPEEYSLQKFRERFYEIHFIHLDFMSQTN